MRSLEFTTRSFSDEDVPELVELWNRTMPADPINEQRLRSDFLLDPHFDREFLMLAVADEHLVGFVFGMSPLRDLASDNPVGVGVVVAFGVEKTSRRQGVGTALFAELEKRWRKVGITSVRIGPWIPGYLAPGVEAAAYPGTVEFLSQRGYESGDEPISMRALLTGYEPAASVSPMAEALREQGIEVRATHPDDAGDLIEFARMHFPHWESYVRAALQRLADGDPHTTIHLATDANQVIGFALTDGERFGPFGVNDSYRGRGIGGVLLSSALGAMRAANIHLAYFLWTSEQTSRLYARHGFEIVRRFTMLRKELSNKSQPSES